MQVIFEISSRVRYLPVVKRIVSTLFLSSGFMQGMLREGNLKAFSYPML